MLVGALGPVTALVTASVTELTMAALVRAPLFVQMLVGALMAVAALVAASVTVMATAALVCATLFVRLNRRWSRHWRWSHRSAI
jgi:hypothetical protein